MRIFAVLGLFVLWLVLSGSYDLIHVVIGAIIASMIVWFTPIGPPHVRRVSWLAVLGYVPWLIGRILKSGFHVSRLILHPALPISPKIIHHKTKLTSDGEIVVLGNSITLTPGTITVEVAPGELVVHTIDEASSKDLVNGVFDAKVSRLFSVIGGKQ